MEQLLNQRKSFAKNATNVLRESGVLDKYNNLSNPLFGTQQSMTASHAPFAIKTPATDTFPSVKPTTGKPLSSPHLLCAQACLWLTETWSATLILTLCAGGPLSPISERTSSRQWMSTESLRMSREGRTETQPPPSIERTGSEPSRPATADTAAVLRQKSNLPTVAERAQRDTFSAGGLGRGSGDMRDFMEQLSKERQAFREQHRMKASVGVSRQELRRSGMSRLPEGAQPE